MAAPKTKKHEREKIKAEIARLRIQGKTLREIAEALGGNLSNVAIHYWWHKIEDEWKAGSQADIALYKGKQLREIMLLREEAWAAWQRSQEDAEMQLSKMKRGTDEAGVNTQETQLRKEGQVGDPRFLQVVEWCNEREAKLLGTDAPTEQNINLPNIYRFPVKIKDQREWENLAKDHAKPNGKEGGNNGSP